MICHALRRTIGRIVRESDGAALIEFAYLTPVLLLMFLGVYEFSDAIACSRKVTITARAVADLTSQYSIVTKNDVQTIISASSQIMAPYAAGNATVRVTEITTNAKGKGTIVWSESNNGSDRAAGKFTLPTQLKQANATYILGEVIYSYKPLANVGSLGALSLTQSIYMVPRVSDTVTCNDCDT